MNAVWMWASVTGALGAGIFGVYLLSRPRVGARAAQPRSDEVRQLRDELGRLAGSSREQRALASKVARLEAQLAGQPALCSPSASDEQKEEDVAGGENVEIVEGSEAATSDDPLERSRRDVQARRMLLENAFESQATDPGWSASAERQATEAVSALLPPISSIRRLSCRESLCRVEIAHADPDGHRALLGALDRDIQWAGPGTFIRQEKGSGDTITMAYLGRPGTELP